MEGELFIGERYFEGRLDDLWRKIGELDKEFEEGGKRVEREEKGWGFVGRLEDGEGKVCLEEVEGNDGLYKVGGRKNIMLVRREG